MTIETSAKTGADAVETKPEQTEPKLNKPNTLSSTSIQPVQRVPVSTQMKPLTTSLASAVNKSNAFSMKVPEGLKGISPDNLGQEYFHGLIYAATSKRKTTTAAKMFGPANTLIVLCRQPEQLIPLRGEGYKVLHAETAEALIFALTYPEEAAKQLLNWPEWATLKDRALVFDDISEGIALLLEVNKYKEDGTEYKDMRKVYGLAGQDLREFFQSLRRKPLHLILIALAKVTEDRIYNTELIAPDMPPSMMGMLTTDLEYVFYIQSNPQWKFIVDNKYLQIQDKDEKTGKEITSRREIFAKNKIPMNLVGKVFNQMNEEDLDLTKIWQKIREANKK